MDKTGPKRIRVGDVNDDNSIKVYNLTKSILGLLSNFNFKIDEKELEARRRKIMVVIFLFPKDYNIVDSEYLINHL